MLSPSSESVLYDFDKVTVLERLIKIHHWWCGCICYLVLAVVCLLHYQPRSYFHTTKINIKILKNCIQIKYQPIREEKPIKYKTANKSQPEPAQVDNPNPKSKTK